VIVPAILIFALRWGLIVECSCIGVRVRLVFGGSGIIVMMMLVYRDGRGQVRNFMILPRGGRAREEKGRKRKTYEGLQGPDGAMHPGCLPPAPC
jgi:hypothetical protein